jgi:hypothetical protein
MRHRATAPGLIVASGLTLAGLCAGSAQAQGLQIRDGLWETTMKNPMTGERTHRECLKDAEFDPDKLLEGQSECTMTEQALDGNTLTFTMACAGGNGTAQGRMFVDGDHGGGEVTMHFDMGGRPMDMTMSWDAVRIGDC